MKLGREKTTAEMQRDAGNWFTISQVSSLPADLRTLTIKYQGEAEVTAPNKDPEMKDVLLFNETRKGLVMNGQRSDALAALFGAGNAKGQTVTLEVDARINQITILASGG